MWWTNSVCSIQQGGVDDLDRENSTRQVYAAYARTIIMTSRDVGTIAEIRTEKRTVYL